MSDEVKKIQQIGRDTADLMQPGRLRNILLQLCDRVDEVESMNKMLNAFNSSDSNDELAINELSVRVSQLENNLPHLVSLENTVREILNRYGYQPRR